jgi:hypothetical protein
MKREWQPLGQYIRLDTNAVSAAEDIFLEKKFQKTNYKNERYFLVSYGNHGEEKKMAV